MELWREGLLFLLGLALIVKGGDWFLDGAVWLAETSGVPRFLIGATLVSLATTLPELTVSVTGVLEGETELAVGNAVGSVTANTGLILGLSAACLPVRTVDAAFRLKALLMGAAAFLLTVLCRRGELSLLSGLLLTAVLALDLAVTLSRACRQRGESRWEAGCTCTDRQLLEQLLTFGGGAAAIAVGSRQLIAHGSALALLLGVPAGVIGVTLVAVGTSLPELVTTVTALARREAALSVGNVLGANLIDLTLLLPACAVVSGGALPISPRTAALDLPVLLGLCLLAVFPPLLTGKFYRWQGAALLGGYALYMGALVL